MKQLSITCAMLIGLIGLTGCESNPPAASNPSTSSASSGKTSVSATSQPQAANAQEKTAEKKPDGEKSGSALGGLASLAGAIGSSSTGGGAGSSENKIGAALDLAKAASVTDEEIKTSSLQYRQFADKRAKIAATGNKYAQRLARLTTKHRNEDGLSLNFKVILDPTVNANATADGSIRIYSGLMDLMSDQELLGVIGHEIGHVKLGHTLSKSRAALLASATRKAVASSSGKAGVLADSELGGFGEKLFNSQFSQSAETESDDYGLAFMKKHKYDLAAMESAFRKLAQESGKRGSVTQILSSHPEPGKRADRMREKAKQ